MTLPSSIDLFGPIVPAAHVGALNDVLPTPSWLRVLESWREADRRPATIAFDTTLAAAASAASTHEIRLAVAAGVGFAVVGLSSGLWRRRSSVETQGIRWLAQAAAIAGAGAGAGAFVAGTPARAAALGAGLAFLAIVALRVVAWLVIAASRRRGLGLRPAMIVAPDGWAQQLEHRMTIFPEAGLYCAATRSVPDSGEAGHAIAEELERFRHGHVVLAECPPSVVRALAGLADDQLDCSVVVPVKGVSGPAHLGDIGLVAMRLRPSKGSAMAKRVFDLVIASLVLVSVSPVLLLTPIAIAVSDGRPVLYRLKRVGRDGREFTCFKFRSMVVDAEQRRAELLEDNINVGLLFKLMDDPRITPIGRVIRRLSIDELPQLFNVIRGEMSLVGPRPLPVKPEEFELDAEFRHQILPGITGLWQVHGCNALSYSDMLDLDHTYLVTRSIWTDMVLIVRTIPALLVRRSAV